MTTRGARVARGSLAAVTAVFVAALFHSASGGDVPSALAVTLSLAFAIPLCSVLAGRRMALWRLSLSVVLSQVALHLLFSLGPSSTRFAGASEHLHAGGHLTMIVDPGAQHMSAMMPDSALMWLGHISAALVTIGAIQYGERAIRSFAQTTAIGVVRFAGFLGFASAQVAFAFHTPDAAPRVRIDVRAVIRPALRITFGGLRHRGPPTGILCPS